MPPSIRFVFAIHNHQPVGNFDKVLEQAHEDSYRPFLDTVEKYPEFKFGFHTSGPLFEWWERRHPDQLQRLARLAKRGQMEVIGGGFYEPILPILPERDRRGQIRAFSEYLERRLRAAGAQAMLFKAAAVEKIFESTRGVPRLINNLATTGLLAAASAAKKHVDLKEVEAAAFDLDHV